MKERCASVAKSLKIQSNVNIVTNCDLAFILQSTICQFTKVQVSLIGQKGHNSFYVNICKYETQNELCPFLTNFWENLQRANLLFGFIWPLLYTKVSKNINFALSAYVNLTAKIDIVKGLDNNTTLLTNFGSSLTVFGFILFLAGKWPYGKK